jgi:hypothetical protein
MGGQPNNTLLGSLYGAWQQHKAQQQQQQNQTDQQMQSGMDHDIAGPDATTQAGWSGDAAPPPGMEDTAPQPALSPATQDSPPPQAMDDALDLASDSFARGQIVTSPTIARLGESGPEAVVPLSGGPHDKVSGAMLTDQPIAAPHNLGGTARARFSHPGKAVATARYKPIAADLPLRPNNAVR